MSSEQLYDALSQGEVEKFQQFLQRNPYLVESVTFQCSRTVLHVAVQRGQVAIVEEVLKINPRLARISDSQKSSPLHIAVEEGNLEIARKLLSVAPEMCWYRNDQCLNPVHIAAMKGHVEALKTLLQDDPLPAMERAYRGQTVLHLCVKHRQLMALKFLMDELVDLGCMKDDDGETVLHWAIRSKQVEMVKYLADYSKVEKQARNSTGKTAGDIMALTGDTAVIEDTVRILLPPRAPFWSNPKRLKEMSKKREQTMVVMILIATMAFQAAVSPPGGVWQDNTPSHRAGEAVIATTHPKIYKHLMRANTAAFVSSLITIFLVAVQPRIVKAFLWLFSRYLMWVAIASTAVSYGGAVLVSAPNTQARSLTGIINVAVAVSLSVFGIMFLIWCLAIIFGDNRVYDILQWPCNPFTTSRRSVNIDGFWYRL